MYPLPSNHDAAGGVALREIVRTLRHLCLLHELGSPDEAVTSLRRQLDELVAGYRSTHGAESLSDDRVGVMLRDEEERVAAATTLSDVLAPLLAERLQAPSPGPPSGRQAKAALSAAPATPRRPGISPAIVDLIDGMLAQEEKPSGPRRRT